MMREQSKPVTWPVTFALSYDAMIKCMTASSQKQHEIHFFLTTPQSSSPLLLVYRCVESKVSHEKKSQIHLQLNKSMHILTVFT